MNAGDRRSARTDIAVDGILAMGREHCSVADQFFKGSAARVAETAARLIQVLQKGYLLRDRLLRPVRVAVARAPEKEEGETQTEEAGD